jgi:hypothetical protein
METERFHLLARPVRSGPRIPKITATPSYRVTLEARTQQCYCFTKAGSIGNRIKLQASSQRQKTKETTTVAIINIGITRRNELYFVVFLESKEETISDTWQLQLLQKEREERIDGNWPLSRDGSEKRAG